MTTESPGAGASTSPLRSQPALLTFLIADVRGYTHFTAEHGDDAAARLADGFASLCEQALEAHEGRVIELRGDEALAVFTSARLALRGAVAFQQACRRAAAEDGSLPLGVGIGLDAGEAIPVRGGYRGGALNLAARLCSLADAGEILASAAVIHLARRTEGLAFVDRGPVTLKGLPAPVQVYQIAPEGELPLDLPPLQPLLVTHPTNLPDDSTPFVGREAEIEAIAALLRRSHVRLVTLTGPGGTGKTRLALQVGSRLLYEFRDGVFFCDLSPLTDASVVPSAIAEVLALKEQRDRGVIETLIDHLKEKHLLLVLDNFEHLLSASQVVSDLLAACRDLHILVTSRITLHLSREHEHLVPPLSVPDLKRLPGPENLSQYESVALFIERAKAVRESFTVTDQNAPAIAEICFRLDGLPLAIELAAARIKLFPPQALLQRLSSGLTLLTGGARDRPTRQQTLRGTIDWSYSLLLPEEQTLFARISVFAGGCTFEAAETVCNPDAELDLLEGMGSLVDKSLLRREGEDEPHFQMLETIREYAAEKLAEREEQEGSRRRHAEHFLALARSANLTIEDEGPMRHERVIRERDNLRAAIEWACESREVELGLQLVVALENYWVTNSPREGQQWLQELLQRAEQLPDELRAHALRCYGNNAGIVGQFEEGIRYYERSLAEYRRLGDERGVGIVLQRLGTHLSQRGEAERARLLVEESLGLHEKIGFKKGEAVSLGVLADFERRAGNEEAAYTLYERSIRLAQESGFVWWHAAMLVDLADLLLTGGRMAEANGRALQALALYARMGDRQSTIYVLALLARLAGEAGYPERAGSLWGAIEAEEARSPVGQWETERDEYAAPIFAHAGPEFEHALKRGRLLSLSEAVTYALDASVAACGPGPHGSDDA